MYAGLPVHSILGRKFGYFGYFLTSENEMSKDIKSAAHTVLSLVSAFPSLQEVERVLSMVAGATARGYFTPDEDDALRDTFARYLRSRAALLETLKELRPLAVKAQRQKTPDQPGIFIVCYAATILLMRAGQVLVNTFAENEFAANKLDEAEPRFGIARKELTRVYRSSTSARSALAFVETNIYWKKNRDKFIQQYESDSVLGPVIQLIGRNEPWVKTSADFYTENLIRYRIYSFLRRNKSGLRQITFALFKASGGIISGVRLSWSKRTKRVVPKVKKKLTNLMEPGDILVTRHDHAASNLFLPGFWPHVALYIGNSEQRSALDLLIEPRENLDHESEICFLEALKDGVRFRTASSTLGVDA